MFSFLPNILTQDKVRHTLSDPQLGYVNAYGYVSLFPFLLNILKPDNPKLEIILKVQAQAGGGGWMVIKRGRPNKALYGMIRLV